MKKPRRRIKQDKSLKERLAAFAKDARDRAALLPSGPEREALLREVSRADTASHLDDWINSTGLQPPKE
jgi:hypothetical protein